MMVSSECVLTYSPTERVWTAEFPQYNNVATSGKTREEALKNATEVLAIEAAEIIEEKKRAPKLEHVAEVVLVSVNVTETDLDEMHYMPQARAAETLEVTPARISALIKSGILEAKTFNGVRKVSIESVNQYRQTPRKAGRPKLEV